MTWSAGFNLLDKRMRQHAPVWWWIVQARFKELAEADAESGVELTPQFWQLADVAFQAVPLALHISQIWMLCHTPMLATLAAHSSLATSSLRCQCPRDSKRAMPLQPAYAYIHAIVNASAPADSPCVCTPTLLLMCSVCR